jgi:hypothetical protein
MHDGYRVLEDPVMHRRFITLDKAARRIAIDDTLEMDGRHEVELFMHCHEECEVVVDSNLVTLARGGRRIEILLPEIVAAEVRVLRGSVDPIGGWVSRAFDRKQPSATIVWRARLAGRAVLHTRIECGAMLRSDQAAGRQHPQPGQVAASL